MREILSMGSWSMEKSEKMIQNEILDFLRTREIGYFWQNDSVGIKGRKRETSYRPNGVPDILGVVSGQFVGIEVKTPKGKISVSQEVFRERFIKSGGIYILARSVFDVLEICKVRQFC